MKTKAKTAKEIIAEARAKSLVKKVKIKEKKKGKKGFQPGNKLAVGLTTTGRSTVFKPEYSKMLIDFFDVEPFRKEVVAISKAYNGKGNLSFEKEEKKLMANKLPTLVRFADKIGVYVPTLHDWIKKGQEVDEEGNIKYPEFNVFYYAYTHTRDLYKEFLTQNGLLGLYPPQFAIFIAKNTTDYKDHEEKTPINLNFQIESIKIIEDQLPAVTQQAKIVEPKE